MTLAVLRVSFAFVEWNEKIGRGDSVAEDAREQMGFLLNTQRARAAGGTGSGTGCQLSRKVLWPCVTNIFSPA